MPSYLQRRLVFGETRDPGVVEEAITKGAERSKSGTLKANPLVVLYGPGPADRRCQDCVHLTRHQYGTTWFKCELRRNTHSVATDHRARWPACGRFEPLA